MNFSIRLQSKYFRYLGIWFLLWLGACSQNVSDKTSTPVSPETINWYAGVGQFNGSLDFGNIIDSSVKLLTITVKNVGDSSLTGPVTLSGSDFTLAYQNCEA
jgi:hypothetical protein